VECVQPNKPHASTAEIHLKPIFFGSVGPDDFAKNYAAWARKFGLSDWANWLNQHASGPRIFWSVVLVTILYLIIAFGLPFLITRATRNVAAVAVPVCVALILVIAGYGQYTMSFPVERHVSPAQAAKLKEILGPVAANFSQIHHQ
jgi:hypothetical protein